MSHDDRNESARARLARWYYGSLRPRLVRAADERRISAVHARQLDSELGDLFASPHLAAQPVRAERANRRR